jgi:hypothetical protein
MNMLVSDRRFRITLVDDIARECLVLATSVVSSAIEGDAGSRAEAGRREIQSDH